MILNYILLGVIVILLICVIALIIKNKNGQEDKTSIETKSLVEALSKDLNRVESALKIELKENRDEMTASAKANREEMSLSIKNLGETLSKNLIESFGQQKDLLDIFSRKLDTLTNSNNEKLDSLTKTLEVKLTQLQESNSLNNKESRKELKEGFESFKKEIENSLNNYKDAQRENFDNFQTLQKNQHTANNEKLEAMKSTIERSIKGLQEGNEKKLEEMRVTVDEKLQKTLETRLGESFKLVSDRLEAVHKGLGDMQQLAIGVGDLKKVLSNVKTRGVLGEYQLENILDQLLTPEQYGKNIRTKVGSNASVEFAIKLPGREDQDKTVWLPVDSKFPKEDFELLSDAYENVTDQIEVHRKNFVRGIKKCAQDIRDKYIDSPNTTDFAILFLPFESLYAEVLRTPGLFEALQKDYKIIITGPTTLSALLSSLQMGFRTLAIEKRTSEVWDLLGAVKTEFSKFGGILEKTKKKLQEASNVIDDAGIRSRAIERKLKDITQLPQEQTTILLGDLTKIENTEEPEEEGNNLDATNP
jgi:DNA recombination protein RmuC